MRVSNYQKYLLLLGCLCIGTAAHARALSFCHKSDVQLNYVGTDVGAGTRVGYYALKNTSKRTCIIHGYVAKTVISGYVDSTGKLIPHKRGKIETAHVTGAAYTLRPDDTAYFSTNGSAPNGDVNAVVKKVVFYFRGIRGPFTVACNKWMGSGDQSATCGPTDYATYKGFQFNGLTKDKPNL